MDEKLKKRLVGAAVLASLAVIFVPMLVEQRAETPAVVPPPTPAELEEPTFDSRLLREEVPAPLPLPPPVTVESGEAGDGEPPPAGPALKPRVGLSVWVVQVGSFSSRDNAERLVKKLRDNGLDVMEPDVVEIRGQKLFRVQVGPEIERARAEALLPRVKEITELDGKVLSYP